MKLLLASIIICSNFLVAPTNPIASITVHYLPWDLHTRGDLSQEEVRNFNHGKNHTIIITDSTALDDFERNLNTQLLEPIKVHGFDTRMVMDITYVNGQTATVALNKQRDIKIGPKVYKPNPQLNQTIAMYVPEMMILNGEIKKIVAKKGTFTEEEIESYKQKGILIIEQ